MNSKISLNFSIVKPCFLYIPFILTIAFVAFLASLNALCPARYIEIQKDSFFYINHFLGQYPNLQINFTQLGDALLFLSLLSIFIVYAPAMWESLVSASIVSLIVSYLLKQLFSVPRPAAVFDPHSFIITGERLAGHHSLPSGHTITIFTTFTILLYAFMPAALLKRVLWYFLIFAISYIVAFSRVGVGAHYPLDVVSGSITGYFCGLSGILLNQKLKVWTWIGNKKFYPVFLVLFIGSVVDIIIKITQYNLAIYYLSIFCLIVSLVITTRIYVKK